MTSVAADKLGPPEGLPAALEHFIGGAPAASADGATFEVADPVTNRPSATVAAGGPADVDHAVTMASDAFAEGPWPAMPGRERARILTKIADGIEARAQRIAELETFDTGLPVTQARGQAARAAENFRFFADLAVTLHEDAFRTNEQFGYVIRQPAGVAGLITPWNTPFMLATWKLAPAPGRGVHGGAQAGRVDPAVGQPAAGDHDRGRPARRRGQPGARHRRGGRRRARRAPAGAPHLVHRRDQHRPHDHGRRRAAPQGPVHGTGRQIAVRHLRRRRPGPGHRQRLVRRVLPEWRAVYGGFENFGRTARLPRSGHPARRPRRTHPGG